MNPQVERKAAPAPMESSSPWSIGEKAAETMIDGPFHLRPSVGSWLFTKPVQDHENEVPTTPAAPVMPAETAAVPLCLGLAWPPCQSVSLFSQTPEDSQSLSFFPSTPTDPVAERTAKSAADEAIPIALS